MAEPVGIDVSIVVDTTTVTVTSEEAVNVAIAPETTDIALAVVPAATLASQIGSTAMDGCNEWGIIIILDAIVKYVTNNQQESE